MTEFNYSLLEQMGVRELNKLKDAIPDEIAKRMHGDLSALHTELESIAKAKGYTLEEVAAYQSAKQRAPVRPKYRHPTNHELTWTGRGRQPLWVLEWLNSGGEMGGLLIAGGAD